MGGRVADVTTYKPQRRNANRHTQRGMSALEQSVQADGWIGAITVAADDETFDGSARIETAAATGFDDPIVVESDGTRPVVVRRVDIPTADDPRAVRLGLAANRVAELNLDWDTTVLAALGESIDLSQFWTRDELAGLLEQEIVAGGGGDDFDTTPDEGPTRVQSGELWQLGEHRLLCGDSTKAEDVARLMGGDRADMMFTDPPYGVDYTGGHFHSGDVHIKRERERLAADDTTAIYGQFLPVVLPYIDGPCYLWFAGSQARDVYNAVDINDCEVHALLIWHKVNATYAAMNAQYKQRHEPMLYFKPKGSTLRWCGPTDECTVWDIKRDARNEHHPTQKPIALAERAIQNHTAATIADFFAGSGSTLIAGIRHKRKVRLMEVSPQYCDVILKRYEAETGQTAVRVDV